MNLSLGTLARFIGIHNNPAGVRDRCRQREWPSILENSHAIPDRKGSNEQVELIDQRILNQRRDEACAAIHNDVLAWRLLELAYCIPEIAILHSEVLSIHVALRLAEGDFR